MPAENTSSGKKFEEALELLNEAAREKKEEIQNLLGDKYEHIKEAVTDLAARGRKDLRRVKRVAEEMFEEGGEKIKETASDLDGRLKENPWPYLGGAALGALLLGYMLGSRK